MPQGEKYASGDLLGKELSAAVIAFHEAVALRLGLSATEWKCLGAVNENEPATAGNLAASTGLTTGAITGILDRLERAGYVRREPNPQDRRSVIIRSLRHEEIRDQVSPIFASLGQAMAKVAGGYSAEELVAIQAFFRQTIDALRNETAKLRDEETASERPRDRPAP